MKYNKNIYMRERERENIKGAIVLTDFIFPVGRISRRTDAKNFNAIPPLVTSGFP